MPSLPYRLNVLSLGRSPGKPAAALIAVELLEVRNLPSGFSPQQINTAYNFTPTVSVNGQTFVADGAGQTIAIVDAYALADPTLIDRELAAFDAYYHLPAPPSFAKLNLETAPPGPNTDYAGWAGEVALDVEWAHAVAPKANLLLVGANSDSDTDLFAAVDAARNTPGVSVVSMSWGFYETPVLKKYDAVLQSPTAGPNAGTGVTFVASSGDDGGLYGPEYPASSPNVLSVGGTALTLNPNGTYKAETAWSFNAFLYFYYGDGGSNGGYSSLYTEPAYQKSDGFRALRNARTVPDVAYVGDPLTGVGVFDGVNGSLAAPIAVGGTSAGAPQWAALIAIANEVRADLGKGSLDGPSQTLPALYGLQNSGAFHDIVGGSNARYRAAAGYDLVTGLGSPIASLVITGLAKYNGPAGLLTGSSFTSAGGSSLPHEVRLPAGIGTGTDVNNPALPATDVISRSTALTVIPQAAPVVPVAPASTALVLVVVTPAPLRFETGTLATGNAAVLTSELLPVVPATVEADPTPVPAEPAAVPPAPPAVELPPEIPQAWADFRATPFAVDFDALPLFAGDLPTTAPVIEESGDAFAVEAGLVAAALVIGAGEYFQPEVRRREEWFAPQW